MLLQQALGAMVVGAVLATWTFGMLPPDLQDAIPPELWVAAWSGIVSYVSALQLGRRVRERLDNMLPAE